MADLRVNICGIDFKNPVIAASGTFGFGREYSEIYDISALGGICSKGITLERREGNPGPRIAETTGGILNSVGLQNPGLEAFLDTEIKFMRKYDTVLIANIAGNTELDYCKMAYEISMAGADMVELNISCPNVKQGGMAFGSKPESIRRITEQVKNHTIGAPLIVKLSPNVSSISEAAKAAEDGGADCISLINTIGGMAVDIKTRKPVLANVFGGLSGPCVKPVALKMVYEAYKAVKIPIIGIGGIMSGEDVVEFLLCGAKAVEVGTANLVNTKACLNIIEELNGWLDKNNVKTAAELTGGLK